MLFVHGRPSTPESRCTTPPGATRSIWLAVTVHVALNLVGDTVAATPIVFGS